MMLSESMPTSSGKRRGRPCASERYNNELIQQKLADLINSPNTNVNDDFARLNVIPLIVKRQRRVRANNRERNRMQNLNEALVVLQQCLPLEFLNANKNLITNLNNTSDSFSSSDSNSNVSKSKTKSVSEATKLTKIDTLRLATKYIEFLTNLLRDDASSSNATISPVFSSTSPSCSPSWQASYTPQASLNVSHKESAFYTQNSSISNVDLSLPLFYKKETKNYYFNDTNNYGCSSLSFREDEKDFNHNTIQFCQNYNNFVGYQHSFGNFNNHV